jgi:acetyltransferase-like isoleucine patch superfamily enzyme
MADNTVPPSGAYHISGRDNVVIAPEEVLREVVFRITGNNNVITIGARSQISRSTFVLSGCSGRIVIGEECVLDGVGVVFEDDDGVLTIGNRTCIHHNAHLAVVEPGRSIVIGAECLFSSYIDIRTSDSHSVIDIASGSRLNYGADVIVGDHVWLGQNVAVLKGSEVGENCVVGMRSVVSGYIPRDSVAVGVPARVIRSGVTWTQARLP